MGTEYLSHDVSLEARPDGTLVMRSNSELGEVAERTTDWLDHWAEVTPRAVFLAEREGEGWREVSYRQARETARSIAAGLLGLGLDENTPILILSGNSVNHGLLALAAQYVGIPIVPIAEQYSLIPAANGQVDFIASLVKPGLVFAEDGQAFGPVLDREIFSSVAKLVSKGKLDGHLTFEDLARSSGDISSAHNRVSAETIAKILMTSGSTSSPKGVPTSHRMMCVNQTQIRQSLPFLASRPPLIVDWLPWNHVFGGSHNFNMMLANGGALYIDGGKPAPQLIGKTLENLRMKTGTMAFNVPVGFALIRDELKKDEDLRRRYFEDMDMLFYAGASLPQDVWADLEEMAREVRGTMPLFTSSWGLTETAPASLLQHEPIDRSGVIGVALPGQEIKLIPDGNGRYEVRVRGPNVFRGYLNDEQKTAEAFDDEGFFKTGDAMAFVEGSDPNKGLRFDGRISEEFKLLTGTWVRAATLRLDVLRHLGELATDVVITGADRNEIGLFIIPSQKVREMADASEHDGILSVPSLVAAIQERLSEIGGSSSTRIARVLMLSEPPQIGEGEITAKGNINSRKLLARRSNLLERLYDDSDPAVIRIA